MVMSSYGGKQDGGVGGMEGKRFLGGGCGDELAKGGGIGVQKSANGKVCTSPSTQAAASTADGAERGWEGKKRSHLCVTE